MTAGKTIALTMQTFVGKVMSLFFNMLFRFVIAFLPRSNRLLISLLQWLSTVILESRKNKICHCFYLFPFYLLWSEGTRCHDLSFFNIEFEVSFSLSSFTLIKRLFSSSSLSVIRAESTTCIPEVLNVFLLEILILACDYPAWDFTWCTLDIS